ncbi:MAG: TIGR03667 family PPOX class F420-dependent oxidoreductase [Acidimicrobiales bacterium]
MTITSHLSVEDRERVEDRLRHNLMAWFTTVRPDGQPVTVPVWFLHRADDSILIYSQPKSAKFRNIEANPRVSFALDVCDLGRNIVRIEGIATSSNDEAPADRQRAYVAKYAERIGSLFESPERFASLFSAATVITPTKLHAG